MNGNLVDDGGPIGLTRGETLVRGGADRRWPVLWREVCEWTCWCRFALDGTIGRAKFRATDATRLARVPLPERQVQFPSHRRVITTACWALAIASSALADDERSETPITSIPTEIGVNADARAMYLEQNAFGHPPADQSIEPIASETATVSNAKVAGEVRGAEPGATASDTGVTVSVTEAQEPVAVEGDQMETVAEGAGKVRVAEPAASVSDTDVMVPAFKVQEPVAVEDDEKETEAEADDEVRADEPATGASDTDVMVPAFEAQEPVAVEADEKGTEAEAGDGVRVDEQAAGASETGVMNPAFEAQEPIAVEADQKETDVKAADDEVRDAAPDKAVADTDVVVPASDAQEPVAVEAEETESQADAYSEVPTDAVLRARVGESASSSHASTSTTAQNVLRMPRTREPIRPIEELDVDPEKVTLGRALFHDPRLSKDSTTACVSCHDLANGGDDGLRVSVGIGGQAGTINAPTVFNVGLNFKQFWDGRADTLEEQIDGPVQSAIELGSLWPEIIAKLHAHESYPARFSALYPDGISRKNVKNALAEFMKSLTTPNSRFDQWLRGDDDALTALEERGYTLFKLYGCVSCHQGANVGGNMFQVFGVLNNYFQKRGNVTDADLGRYNVTGDPLDRHAFKVPSLRVVALTAPYLHDGSAATLREAVDAMFEFQLGRSAPGSDKEAIVAFIKTLPGDNKELFP